MKGKETKYEIFVNDKRFTTDQSQLTGNQIKSLAGVPDAYELFLVKGNTSEPIGSQQVVKIENGMHFRAIPSGTFGTDAPCPT
jgi:hypothetical protein